MVCAHGYYSAVGNDTCAICDASCYGCLGTATDCL